MKTNIHKREQKGKEMYEEERSARKERRTGIFSRKERFGGRGWERGIGEVRVNLVDATGRRGEMQAPFRKGLEAVV